MTIFIYILPFYLLPLSYWLLKYCSYKDIDIFQYKFKNKSAKQYTYTIASMYISSYILGLYILRIYNIGQSLDLKVSFTNLRLLFNQLIQLPIIKVIFICINIVCLLIFLLLIIITFNKYCIHHLYKIYFHRHHKYNPKTANSTEPYTKFQKFSDNFWFKLCCYGTTDIISYYVLEGIYKFTKLIYGENNIQTPKFAYYHPYRILLRIFCSKKYPIVIKLSPLLVFVYDCIYNNFVIIHLYYYLLLYVPVMLLLRFTSFLSLEASVLCDRIWDMYYGENVDLFNNPAIYAISKKDKIVLDYYVLNKFSNGDRISELFQVDMQVHLFYGIKFFPGWNDTYRNDEGMYVKFIGNKLLQELEDDDGNISYGEAWILLQDIKIKN